MALLNWCVGTLPSNCFHLRSQRLHLLQLATVSPVNQGSYRDATLSNGHDSYRCTSRTLMSFPQSECLFSKRRPLDKLVTSDPNKVLFRQLLRWTCGQPSVNSTCRLQDCRDARHYGQRTINTPSNALDLPAQRITKVKRRTRCVPPQYDSNSERDRMNLHLHDRSILRELGIPGRLHAPGAERLLWLTSS
jgi:hypothetical protein